MSDEISLRIESIVTVIEKTTIRMTKYRGVNRIGKMSCERSDQDIVFIVYRFLSVQK